MKLPHIASSGTAQLLQSFQTTGKDSKTHFTSKSMFQYQQKKNADGKYVTCGKNMELCKVSCREERPRESDCSSGSLTLGRSACVHLVMLGVRTAAMFLQRKKITKLGRKITVFSVPVMNRHTDLGLKWHIW